MSKSFVSFLKTVFVMLLLLLTSDIASAEVGTWSAGASDTVGRYAHSAVFSNDKMYVVGGFNGAYLNDLRIYDIASNTWSAGTSDTVVGKFYSSAVVSNGKMYVFGGSNGASLNDLRIYDISSNTWSAGASDTVGRYVHSAVVSNGKMYVFGGYTSSGIVSDLRIYDIVSNTWSAGASDISIRSYHSAVVSNGKMYVFGGYDGYHILGDLRIYDIASNTWSAGAPDVSIRFTHSSVVLNDNMYVFGGYGSSLFNDLRIYDIASNTWSAGAFDLARGNHSAVVSNSKMYVFGGYDGNHLKDLRIYGGGITQDTTAPETTIISAVDGDGFTVTNGDNIISGGVTFNFSGADNVTSSGSLTFACKLDTGLFEPCISPKAYAGLGLGAHSFQVQATDESGNTDLTPDTFLWTIVPPPDTTAPETAVTLATDGKGSTVTNGGTTGSIGMTLEFSGIDGITPSGLLKLECSIDGGGFTSCTSPVTYSALSAATHTFNVRATDEAGNTDPSPAVFSWTVNPVPPETSLLAVDSNGVSVSEGMTTIARGITISFSAVEGVVASIKKANLAQVGGGGFTYECKFDGSSFAPCTSPVAYSDLPLDSHGFEVKATDGQGFVDPTPAILNWEVVLPPDVTAPNTSISGATDGSGSSITAGGTTYATDIDLSFAGIDDRTAPDALTFTCKLDTGSVTPCTSPQAYTTLMLGAHTLEVRATDIAGNTDGSPATFSWTIVLPPDITAPDTSISSAIDGNNDAVGDGGSTFSKSITMSFAGTDDRTAPGSLTFSCKIDSGSFAPCATYSNLAVGTHTFEVKATDAASNTDATPAVFSWTVAVNPIGDDNNDGIPNNIEQALTGNIGGLTVNTTGTVVGSVAAVLNPDSSIVFSGVSADFPTVSYSLALPPGANVPSGIMSIDSIAVQGNRQVVVLRGVVLLPGTTKSMTLKSSPKVCIVDGPTSGTEITGSLGQNCIDSVADYRVKMNCPGTKTATFPDGSRNFNCSISGGMMTISGLKHSVVAGYEELGLGELSAIIAGMNLGENVTKHLIHNIEQAVKKLNDKNLKNDMKSSCREMSDFIRDTNNALKHNEVTSSQANILMDYATNKQQEYGCIVDLSNSVSWLLGLVADLNVVDKAKSSLSVKLDQAIKFLTNASDPALAKQQACKNLVEFTTDVETQTKDKKYPIIRDDADLLLGSTQIVQQEIGCLGTVAEHSFMQSVFASFRRLLALVGFSFSNR